MFAALNTVEPPILELVTAKIFEGDKPWAKDRLPLVLDRVRARFRQLSARLGDAEWLDGAFSAGDLLMVSVLLRRGPRAFSTNTRTSLHLSRAVKRGPRTASLRCAARGQRSLATEQLVEVRSGLFSRAGNG